MDKNRSCCFIGHREIEETPELKKSLINIITDLIVNKNVDTFFLGSKSQFNDLCRKLLMEIKEIYPHIKRIYVRAEYEHIIDEYRLYLLKSYDDTYFPEEISKAGKASYIKRNYKMIDNSRYCIVYLNNEYIPITKTIHQRKSGTKLAYDYAVKKGCIIKNLL